MSQNDVTFNEDNEAMPLRPVVSKTARTKELDGNHVVHILSEEANPDLQDLGLSTVFRPMVYSSLAFGLTWKRPKTKWCDLHTVHSCLIILILCGQNIAYCFSYSKDDEYGTELFQKVIVHILACQLTVGTSIYLYSKYRNNPSFLRQWENYKIKYGGLTLSYMRQHVCRRIVGINIGAVLFMTVSGLVWIAIRPSLYIQWLFPYVKDAGKINMALLVFCTFILCYSILIWFQCALNTLVYCSLLKLEFQQLARQFSDDVNSNITAKSAKRSSLADANISEPPHLMTEPITVQTPMTQTNECEHFRTRYVSLCRLVQKLDDLLNGYLLALYLFSVPTVILLLYCVADFSSEKYNTDRLSALMGINSLVMSIVLLVCITSGGNSLTVAVSTRVILSNNTQ